MTNVIRTLLLWNETAGVMQKLRQETKQPDTACVAMLVWSGHSFPFALTILKAAGARSTQAFLYDALANRPSSAEGP